jgi:hypothetical protein
MSAFYKDYSEFTTMWHFFLDMVIQGCYVSIVSHCTSSHLTTGLGRFIFLMSRPFFSFRFILCRILITNVYLTY